MRCFFGCIFSLPRVGFKLLECCASPIGFQNKIRVKDCADRIPLKIFSRAHPFCRCFPVAEIINL